MTKLKETNEMIKTANKLLNMLNNDSIKDDIQTISLLDIAKSLAIIADGITILNEQIEKTASNKSDTE